jgi:hypothetical protein
MNRSPKNSQTGWLNIDQELVLILTATINIKGMPKAYPTIPEQRQEDYYNALRYYINYHPRIKKILFVENSGWPLDRLRETSKDNPHKKQVEFISLELNDFPRNFGKGYGETLLIEQGILKSELIQESSYIAKITGRIYLLNMTDIIESVINPFECLCDFKWPIWQQLRDKKNNPPYADTRFIIFSKSFYEIYLQPMHKNHQQGCFYSEHQYYKAINSASQLTNVCKRFPIEPEFSGIAGHFQGKDYNSRSEQLKRAVRILTRQTMPWLYL